MFYDKKHKFQLKSTGIFLGILVFLDGNDNFYYYLLVAFHGKTYFCLKCFKIIFNFSSSARLGFFKLCYSLHFICIK